jgi:hypothetical protein
MKKLFPYVYVFFIFFYGFMTHRNQIFPYQIIMYSKNTLINIFSTYNKEDVEIKQRYKNWEDKNPNYYPQAIIKKYFPGINIYLDRNYFNHKNDEKLNGLTLIQINRHNKSNIHIKVNNDIIIYRVLCKKNNNKKYRDWEKQNFELAIIGISCVHTTVVKKKVKRGIVKIASGGPVSSDPIFIDNLESNVIVLKHR